MFCGRLPASAAEAAIGPRVASEVVGPTSVVGDESEALPAADDVAAGDGVAAEAAESGTLLFAAGSEPAVPTAGAAGLLSVAASGASAPPPVPGACTARGEGEVVALGTLLTAGVAGLFSAATSDPGAPPPAVPAACTARGGGEAGAVGTLLPRAVSVVFPEAACG